jgi:hypothetical protein
MTLKLTDPEKPSRPTDQVRGVMLIVSLAGLGAGCFLVFPPAGLIVPSLLLYAASLGLSLRR